MLKNQAERMLYNYSMLQSDQNFLYIMARIRCSSITIKTQKQAETQSSNVDGPSSDLKTET